MSKSLTTFYALLVATELVVVPSPFALGQSLPAPSQTPQSAYWNPVVYLSAPSLRYFDAILPAIAAQARVAIVCEGQPLHLTLSQKDANKLAQHLGPAGRPLEETVKSVAAAYDYDAVRSAADTFVLTKRYSDANDLPDVTFDEVLTSLQNILKATGKFVPPITLGNPPIYEIISSATAEQKAQLARGVSIAQLPADWQQDAWRYACSLTFVNLQDLNRIIRRLQACQKQETIFTYSQYLNLTIPAYQGPFAWHGATDIFAMSAWVDTTPGGGTTIDELPGVKLVGDKIVIAPGATDPTTPRPADKIPPPVISHMRFSLADMAGLLNQRSPIAATDTAIQIDPALAAKTVCLAGGKFASKDSLLQALTDIYGLEAYRTEDTVTVRQPRPNVLSDPDKIEAEVRRLLPAPYLRAVRDNDSKSPKPDISSRRASGLFIASVRRLREIVEPPHNSP